MTQSHPSSKSLFPQHGLGVHTLASAPAKASSSQSTSTDHTTVESVPTTASQPFAFVGQSPKPIADDLAAMRQITEPIKQAITFDPPMVPKFRDLLVLLADNVHDRNQRDSTLDDVQTHYSQVRIEILDRIAALKAQMNNPNIVQVKAAMQQTTLLEESLFNLQAEMDQVEYYRSLPA